MQNARSQSDCNWLMPVRGVFLVLMFAVGMPVWGGTTTAATIDNIKGRSNLSIKDINGYTKTNLYPGKELKEGDVITVKSRSSLTLILNNGKTEKVQSGNSPYTLELHSRSNVGGWLGSIVGLFSNLVTHASKHRFATSRGINGGEECIKANSSSKPFAIPMLMLKNGNAKLLSGKRSQLYVGWAGGSSSDYTLKVSKADKANGPYQEVSQLGKEHISLTQGKCHELMIKEVAIDVARHEFKAGEHYKVEITNSGETAVAVGRFQVVSESHDPFSDTTEVRKEPFHLQAIWLATNKEHNGEWQFEAYQKVSGRENESVRIVRWGLSRGEDLPQLKLIYK